MHKYLFSDESGDMQCRDSPNVSKYFAVGSLVVDQEQLTTLRSTLSALRDNLAWNDQGLDSAFHATTDTQAIRDVVFEVLQALDFRFDVTLLEKRKSQPKIRPDEPTFFQYAWYYHLKYLAPKAFSEGDQVLFVAAELGTKKLRKAFRSSIESVMTQCVPYRVKRTLAFWRDDSDFALQAADYMTWAVTRYYERGDKRSYDLVRHKIRSEYDLFQTGTKYYY